MKKQYSTCHLYRVWAAGEYAVICICSEANKSKGTFSGELLMQTSQGDFGGTISGLKVPFTQYLQEIGRDDFFPAFRGQNHIAFDGEQSLSYFGKAILALRRKRLISSEMAHAIWGDFLFGSQAARQSELSFRILVARSCTAVPELGAPSDYVIRSASAQITKLWTTVWPKFVEMLRKSEPKPLKLVA